MRKNNMLRGLLKHAGTVAIGGHVRPDGDCVGSCMGLYRYVKTCYPEIRADVYLEEIPDSFHFISDTKEICHTAEEKEYDLFIALDCGDVERLGFSKPLFEKARHTFCIDHHISNGAFADENHIEPEASSTSELVYHLLDRDKITKEVAECLYLGMAHDTGVFQYTCTSPSTMEAAAHLMSLGIDYSKIIHDTFYEKTYVQSQILGRALLESFLFLDKQCIVSVITKKIMDFYEASPKDLEGIVAQLRMTKGVKAAVFMYETNPQEFKVSLRADADIDVSRVAKYFGGGGHKKAAGVTMNGTAHDIITNLAHQIAIQLEEE